VNRRQALLAFATVPVAVLAIAKGWQPLHAEEAEPLYTAAVPSGVGDKLTFAEIEAAMEKFRLAEPFPVFDNFGINAGQVRDCMAALEQATEIELLSAAEVAEQIEAVMDLMTYEIPPSVWEPAPMTPGDMARFQRNIEEAAQSCSEHISMIVLSSMATA